MKGDKDGRWEMDHKSFFFNQYKYQYYISICACVFDLRSVLTRVWSSGTGSVARAAGQALWISRQRAAAALRERWQTETWTHESQIHKSITHMFTFYGVTLFHHGVAAANWVGSLTSGEMCRPGAILTIWCSKTVLSPSTVETCIDPHLPVPWMY